MSGNHDSARSTVNFFAQFDEPMSGAPSAGPRLVPVDHDPFASNPTPTPHQNFFAQFDESPAGSAPRPAANFFDQFDEEQGPPMSWAYLCATAVYAEDGPQHRSFQ